MGRFTLDVVVSCALDSIFARYVVTIAPFKGVMKNLAASREVSTPSSKTADLQSALRRERRGIGPEEIKENHAVTESMRRGEGLVGLLTEVPWWMSGIIAGVVYVGLRWVLPSIEFNNLVLKSLAAATPQAAWFFALLFLIPGLVSFLKRKERQHLLDTRSDLVSIRKLSWSDFELLIGEAFRRQGYAVEERGGNAPDGGVDLVLRKDGQKTLVQCKHWKTQQVGVSIVRELLGVVTAQSAIGGIVVTAGDYTAEAPGGTTVTQATLTYDPPGIEPRRC
jgi:hypothetical protein